MAQPNEWTPSRLDKFIQNLPPNLFKNLIANPIMGIPGVIKAGYDVSPIGQSQYLVDSAKSLIEGKLPNVPPGIDMLKGFLQEKYNAYKDPLKLLEEDPGQPIVDLLSILAPTRALATTTPKLGARLSTAWKNYVINKAGRAPSSIPSELMTDMGGDWMGASKLDVLRESLKRGLPVNWAQAVENKPNPGFIESWVNPTNATIFDPLLESKNRAQAGATRNMAQELVGPDVNILNEPGVNLNRIQGRVSGSGGQTEQLWDSVSQPLNDIMNRANQVIVPFTYEVEKQVPVSGGFTRSVKQQVTTKVAAPIILTQTYPILEKMQEGLNSVKESLIKNNLAMSDYMPILNNLKGMLENPSYKTLQGKFNIGDLNTLYRTKQGLNRLRNYIKKNMQSSGLASELKNLNDAMGTDILTTFEDPHGHGLYANQPGLAIDFQNYLQSSRETLKLTHTPAYKSLGKSTWEGINTQEIMNDPSKGIPAFMSSYNNFEKGVMFVGQDTAKQVLLTDLFEQSLNKSGPLKYYDYSKISEYLGKNRDKINLVMNTDQKHALGVWTGIVQNQNKLNELQKAQYAMELQGDKGLVNIVSGVAAQRPGLFALGIVREGQLIFAKKFLAKIASDPDAAYAAARLTQTHISSPTMMTRTKDFLRKVGKLNMIGQFQQADGSMENVKITSDGSIVNADEVAKPQWW